MWTLSESTLRGLLHALKLPFRVMIISSLAINLIGMIARFSNKRGQIIKSTLLIIFINWNHELLLKQRKCCWLNNFSFSLLIKRRKTNDHFGSFPSRRYLLNVHQPISLKPRICVIETTELSNYLVSRITLIRRIKWNRDTFLWSLRLFF